MKTDSPVKKHHFWILCGAVPLLTLIGVLMVSSSVGGKIAEREKAIADAKSTVAGKQPKPTELIAKAEKAVKKVSDKQGDLHKDNWEKQKHLFTWPEGSALLKKFNTLDFKFGAILPTSEGELEEFRNRPAAYLYEYSSIKKDGSGAPGTGMADRIAPTQFRGGWQSVLRHVSDFGQYQLNKDQVWLMMEDIWVQRSMLDAVRSINADMATFRRAVRDKDGNVVVDPSYDDKGQKWEGGKKVETPEPEKKKALFRSRTWGLDLELVREGSSHRLVGTLTNLSERLQLMGVGNVMTLHVWFSKDPTAAPLVFKIGGEFLPGKGAVKRGPDGKDGPANVLSIVPIDDHVLPAAMSADEIVRVEQVFDVRTVPVKRIEALALGFLDARNAAAQLKAPLFIKDDPATDPGAAGGAAAAGFGSGDGPPPMPGAGGPPPGLTGAGAGGFGGFGGGNNAARKVAWGAGPLAAVTDGNKRRYLEVSGQVRRMPVGIVVVVDQSYMEDTLLAFANSPLRFQITQVAWTRFRGTLAGIGATSGGSSGPGAGIDFGGGTVNFGGSGDPDDRGGGYGSYGPRPGGPGAGGISKPGFGSGFGPSGPSGPTGPFGPGGPTGPFGPGSPSNPTASTVSESQITSGLVELSIYGIVSLYEKYEAPKPPDATAGTPPTGADPKAPDAKTPEPKDPKTPDPKAPDAKEGDPKAPADPKTPDPKAPEPKAPAPAPSDKKMRRRARA